MMDDQLEQYIEYLKEEGYSDCNIVDGYIFIKLKIENKDIVLKCNLDSPFPYKFPSIYIVRDRSDEIEAIPHKMVMIRYACMIPEKQFRIFLNLKGYCWNLYKSRAKHLRGDQRGESI